MSGLAAETIFAPATPPGAGGVAVIRISGPHAHAVLETLGAHPLPAPRLAALRKLTDPATQRHLDEALLLCFKAPHSYTGEDIAEIHAHGGIAVVKSLLSVLSDCAGLRPAMPGEFTRRAFENGRMDLTQAEAVNDLIRAETALQADMALDQMGGALSNLYEDWRQRLAALMAHVEAEMEFPDEELPISINDLIGSPLDDLVDEIAAHLDDNRRGERMRDGFSIAIIGAPNAGKSSLLNQLAQREAAIVSETAGTTRDVIEVHLDLAGYPIILADTAGLRLTEDSIEDEGIRRARARAEAADLKLALFDAEDWPDVPRETLALMDEDTLPVLNKTDLMAEIPKSAEVSGHEAALISAADGAGIPALLDRLVAMIEARYAPKSDATLTRARHRKALQDCMDSLARARSADLPELAAEDLRLALRAIGSITGRVDVEDLLDIIFRDFCIGK